MIKIKKSIYFESVRRFFSCKKSKTIVFVMMRHGKSEWNASDQFTGWYNANLCEKGREEAIVAAKAIQKTGIKFDAAHTSILARSVETTAIVLCELGQQSIPVFKSWRLNERHYGNLTGFSKAETAEKYGKDQLQIWRRSYDSIPPSIEKNHIYYKAILEDPIYRGILKPEDFPLAESLKMNCERTIPYWNEVILPQIKEGKTLFICAHGNSLRGIVKYLDNISDKDIISIEIPTAIPFVYELDENHKPIISMKFLHEE